MNGYLTYLAAGEHASDLMNEASRRRLRRAAKRSRAAQAQDPQPGLFHGAVAPVYCVRAAGPVRRAAA